MAEKAGKVAQAYEAEAEAVRVKTAKLRAARLAREAAEAASRPAAPAPKKTPKGAAKQKPGAKPAGTLADWMKVREEGGHNN